MPSARRHHQPTESRIQVPRPVSSCAPIVGGSSLSDEALGALSSPLALGVAGSDASLASGLGEADGAAGEADWAAVELSAADCGVASSPASARACAGRAMSARVRAAVRARASARRARVGVDAMTVPCRWKTVLL